MNILYLHGLKSKLSPAKLHILQQYGKVYAPDIDYLSKHIQPLKILKAFPDTHFNVVIGSSMGALNAFIISENIGRPALLFNPPLVKYQPIEFDAKYVMGLASKQIVLGGQDDIVDPRKTLEFLKHHLTKFELDLKVDPKLGHRIPVDIFETEVATFFAKLCY